ncbi:MAG: S-adenosylmethionine:tRNA ribosyltransferase-isomerase, partial [Lachnospiraceae bacterium]|nr:S-adenosylmethionine:tRNA ribosyltransferase-isomerase [Lachnospiraceae bacterium]
MADYKRREGQAEGLRTADFAFDLPGELIAQDPLTDRSASRLLMVDKNTGERKHEVFKNILDYLYPGDCLVLNNTKVLPARLLGVKEDTGAAVEVLLLKRRLGDVWDTLVKTGKKMKPGARLSFGGGLLKAEVLEVA